MDLSSNRISLIISEFILTPLSQWLEHEKGVKVSVSDMSKALNIPVHINDNPQVPVMPTLSQNSNIVDYLKMKNTPEDKNVIKRIRKPRNAYSSTCQYVFISGKHKGQQCGNACESTKGYCNSCLNKKSVQDLLNNNKSTTDTPTNKTRDLYRSIDVYPHPEKTGTYITSDHNFIIQQMKDGILFTDRVSEPIEEIDSTTGATIIKYQERSLTQEEKIIAKEKGLATVK